MLKLTSIRPAVSLRFQQNRQRAAVKPPITLSQRGARERPWVRRSATDQFLQVFGVPSPVHRDLGGSALDLTEIVGRQLDCHCAKVLLQALQLSGAGDGHNPRLLRQQPRQRDLRRGRLLPCGDLAKQINQRLIRFARLWRKARDDVAEVGTCGTSCSRRSCP